MRRPLRASLALLTLLALSVVPSSAQHPGATPSPSPHPVHGSPGGGMHPGHDFKDVERWVRLFEDPARDEWQKPDLVVDLTALGPGMRVADIGAGTGYFARRFARAVGPRGDAFAVDVEPALLGYLRERAAREGLANLFTVEAAPDDPRLPPGSMDRVFMCNTLHHVDGWKAYLRTLKGLLAPGGRLVLVEYYKDRDLPVGPPPEMRLDPADLAREMEECGFQVERRDVLPYQYVLIGR